MSQAQSHFVVQRPLESLMEHIGMDGNSMSWIDTDAHPGLSSKFETASPQRGKG